MKTFTAIAGMTLKFAELKMFYLYFLKDLNLREITPEETIVFQKKTL